MNQIATDFAYLGNELELFAKAHTWHRYLRKITQPYIKGSVLEVGAGHGTLTKALCRGNAASQWLCLDPDSRHIAIINKAIADGELPSLCRTRHGYAAGLLPDARFDTILYMDVLEHIEGDRTEMAVAAKLLATGGHLIVLSPAFEALRSPRDDVLGHFRRYTRASIRAVMPGELKQVQCRFVDSFGALAVLANRMFLRQKEAGTGQLRFWDQRLIPLSRAFDPLFRGLFGRSIMWVGRAVT